MSQSLRAQHRTLVLERRARAAGLLDGPLGARTAGLFDWFTGSPAVTEAKDAAGNVIPVASVRVVDSVRVDSNFFSLLTLIIGGGIGFVMGRIF